MKRIGKVVWGEGMFLTPQLFQQADRYHESLLQLRMRALSPYCWGMTALEIDKEALANGQVNVARCAGVLPDGVPLQVPEEDAAPGTRAIRALFTPTVDRLSVFLALPVVRDGANIRLSADSGGPPARYQAQMVPVVDDTAGDNEGEIPLARKNLRLLFTGEALDDTVWIKLAEVTRTESGSFELDEAYVPPVLTVAASPRLTRVQRDILELLVAKATALGGQRRHIADFATSDMATFWLLHTVNSHIPLLVHLAQSPEHHPEHLYLALAQLAGQLSSFALDSDPRDLPQYDHEDLGRTFGELEKKIRFLLDAVIPTRYVVIPLVRTRDLLHVGQIQDERLIKTAQFFLGASSQMPAGRLIESLPAKAKISAPDTVTELIGRAVPGVELLHEPVPPSAIPVKPGFKYFQLSPQGRSWEAIGRARALALYLPDEFPELRLELVALKS